MLVVYIELDPAARAYFQSLPIDAAPPAYRARLARKSHPNALAQSVAGLWLLEKALEYTGHETASLTGIGFDTHDRPQFAAGPAFSISHSDNHAACALVDTPANSRNEAPHVGLDIEEHRPIVPARLARLMSTAERAVVEHDPAGFFDYWCAREATVKATGRVGLRRIKQVRLGDGEAWLDERRWTLYPLALAPGLAACLASDAPAEAVRVRRLTVPAKA